MHRDGPRSPDAHAPGAAPETGSPAPGALPIWDLSDLYPAPDDPRVAADLDAAAAAARAFAAGFAGRLASLSGAELAAAIAEYERIDETLGRLVSYAGLLFNADATDAETGRFYQGITERVTAISSELIFFTLELNRLDDAILEPKLADPALARWRPWLRDLRVFRPHQLSDELERLLHEKEVTGRAAWSRLFDETMAAMRIPLGDASLTVTDALNKLSDRDRAVREAAGRAIGTAFGERIRLFSLITNTLAKDKEIVDTWRHYPRPGSYRNRSNMVEDEVVDALVAAVTSDYPRLSHRYYLLKAKWLGLPKLQHWDRNAPLPDDDDRVIGWEEARARVLAAYRGFSPEMAEVGARFFAVPLDRRGAPARQGGRRVRPSHGAVRTSLHPAQLSRPHARRDDARARAGPRRASGAGRLARAICSPARRSRSPRPRACSARC